jgi:hypothetical protein
MADFYYFMAAYLTIGRQVFHVHSPGNPPGFMKISDKVYNPKIVIE